MARIPACRAGLDHGSHHRNRTQRSGGAVRRLLVLNFFPAFVPPSSGGEQRYFHMYSRLSRSFDVTLLSPTYGDAKREVVVHSPTFREHRIPKEPVHDRLHAEIAAENLADETSALVCALSARFPNAYHEAYLELQEGVDCIVHESPYMVEYDLLLGADRRPRVYNSYNVESDLVAGIWKGAAAPGHLATISALERRLIESCGLCFAVSESEADRFAQKYAAPRDLFALAENGIVAEEFAQRARPLGGRKQALFFGSFHPPNIEAARFIVDQLAPACADIDFVIAGNCMSAGASGLPANVSVLGRVDNAQRLELFAQVDFALNPMSSGAGTNLKALEYLAAGVPMLTTGFGARGLDLRTGEHAVIADKVDFAVALRRLAGDGLLRERLSVAGKAHVVKRFSWDAIAERTTTRLEAYLEAWRSPARKAVLVLNDFSAANPMGGGEVRINRIYSALARTCRVTLVCFAGADQLRTLKLAPDYFEIQVPKTSAHRREDERLAREWHVSAADIVNFLEGPRDRLLVTLVDALLRVSDVAVLLHPYMAGLVPAGCPTPIVYESLNHETSLKRHVLAGHPRFQTLAEAAERAERLAIALSTLVVFCSDTDRQGLIGLGARPDSMHLVPNGVELSARAAVRGALEHVRIELGGRPLMVFVGSGHPPNQEAAAYILSTLAPALPDCVFALVGGVCGGFSGALPPNVLALGVLDSGAKDVVVEMADLALNPMVSGSGSNLKLAEYFSKAIPVVTTRVGARGYAIRDGQHALICDLENFPARIRQVLGDPVCLRRLGEGGLRFAQAHLDWEFQANRFRAALERGIFSPGKRRLLVITFRFTDPPMGGAEVHLLELLRQVDRLGDFVIDVATLDVADIENRFHFSARYRASPRAAIPRDIASLSVYRFPVDATDASAHLEGARRLFAAWIEEWRAFSVRHLDLLPPVILLGGWYSPQRGVAGVEAWCAPRALFRANAARTIRLRGYSPLPNRLTVAAGVRQLLVASVDGEFDLCIDIGHAVDVLELNLAESYIAPDDARIFGVLMRDLSVDRGDGLRTLDLATGWKNLLGRLEPAALIDGLVDAARARAPDLEELFQTLRGPSSSAMESWLTQRTADYDLVLGHCAPFGTMLSAARHATATGVPLVQLPSFHVDDDFYHWRSYYDALCAADCCLVHPRAALPLFYDRIGAKAVYAPPGVDPDEEASPADEVAFFAAYGSSLPFVLVLGRKNTTKNYAQVIDAVVELNSAAPACRVVFIGRDEDAVALDAGVVAYLGAQPRGAVLAALKHAVCLVTMSDSESFGIVILEAWAQRKPVIVSAACIASAELVEDGVDGLLATPANLAEKIRWLLDHPEQSRAMGEAGRGKLLREFTWQAVGREANDILKKIVDGRAIAAATAAAIAGDMAAAPHPLP